MFSLFLDLFFIGVTGRPIFVVGKCQYILVFGLYEAEVRSEAIILEGGLVTGSWM